MCGSTIQVCSENSAQNQCLSTTDVDLEDFIAKRSLTDIDVELESFDKTLELQNNLLELAKVLLSIKATSTDAEHTFSICADIFQSVLFLRQY